MKDDFGNPFSVAAVIKDIKGGELNNAFDVVDFKGVVDVELENAHVLFNNGVEIRGTLDAPNPLNMVEECLGGIKVAGRRMGEFGILVVSLYSSWKPYSIGGVVVDREGCVKLLGDKTLLLWENQYWTLLDASFCEALWEENVAVDAAKVGTDNTEPLNSGGAKPGEFTWKLLKPLVLSLLATTALEDASVFVDIGVVGFSIVVVNDDDEISVLSVLKGDGVVVVPVVFGGNLKEKSFIAAAPLPVVVESKILKMFFEHVDLLIDWLFFGVRFWLFLVLSLLVEVFSVFKAGNTLPCWESPAKNDGDEFEWTNENEFGLVKENEIWLFMFTTGNDPPTPFIKLGLVFTPTQLKCLVVVGDADVISKLWALVRNFLLRKQIIYS